MGRIFVLFILSSCCVYIDCAEYQPCAPLSAKDAALLHARTKLFDFKFALGESPICQLGVGKMANNLQFSDANHPQSGFVQIGSAGDGAHVHVAVLRFADGDRADQFIESQVYANCSRTGVRDEIATGGDDEPPSQSTAEPIAVDCSGRVPHSDTREIPLKPAALTRLPSLAGKREKCHSGAPARYQGLELPPIHIHFHTTLADPPPTLPVALPVKETVSHRTALRCRANRRPASAAKRSLKGLRPRETVGKPIVSNSKKTDPSLTSLCGSKGSLPAYSESVGRRLGW